MLVHSNDINITFDSKFISLLDGAFGMPRRGKNNDKAHPPIHPTGYSNDLNREDRRVFEFVVRRFLGCCSTDAKGFETTVEIEIARERFHAKGKIRLALESQK